MGCGNDLSFTRNEAVAARIVDRLCRRPPYGEGWRAFAIREISTALTMEAARRRREDADLLGIGGANAAAPR
jgi:hypothetical protein